MTATCLRDIFHIERGYYSIKVPIRFDANCAARALELRRFKIKPGFPAFLGLRSFEAAVADDCIAQGAAVPRRLGERVKSTRSSRSGSIPVRAESANTGSLAEGVNKLRKLIPLFDRVSSAGYESAGKIE